MVGSYSFKKILIFLGFLLVVGFSAAIWQLPFSSNSTNLPINGKSTEIGFISPDQFSAYTDLVAEGKITPHSTLITSDNIQNYALNLIKNFTARSGLLLSQDGTNTTLEVNPGEGLTIRNGQVVATLGNSVDLASGQVHDVLPIGMGGTGLSAKPADGQILIGSGGALVYKRLVGGDGMVLGSTTSALSVAVDGSVCRTSGNCGVANGIAGKGSANHLAKFAVDGTIGDSTIYDDGSHIGIGTDSPTEALEVAGNAKINGSAIVSSLLASTSGNVAHSVTTDISLPEGVYVYADGFRSMVMGNDGFARMVGEGLYPANEVEYFRCQDADCINRTVQIVATNPAGVGEISIAMGKDGMARILYAAWTLDGNGSNDGNTVHYIRCLDADCISRVDTVAATNNVSYLQMALSQDDTANIIFKNYTGHTAGYGEMNFLHCTNADCSTHTTQLSIDGINEDHGNAINMGADGLPRMVYGATSSTVHEIRYATCLTVDCSSVQIATITPYSQIDNAAPYHYYMQLGSDGMPRIGTAPFSGTESFFIRCTAQDCSTSVQNRLWTENQSLSSMALGLDGLPRFTMTGDALNYWVCTDADCLDYRTITVPNIGYAGTMVFGSDGLPRLWGTNFNTYPYNGTFAHLIDETGQPVVGVNVSSVGSSSAPFDLAYINQLYGTDAYFSGNVGIDTNQPQFPLDVNGNINANGLYIYGTQRLSSYGGLTISTISLDQDYYSLYYGNEFSDAESMGFVDKGDVLRYKTPTTIEQYSGGNWITYAGAPDFGPIADGRGQTVTTVPASVSEFRLTYQTSGCAAPYALFQQGYQELYGTLTIETSADQVTWSQRGFGYFSGGQTVVKLTSAPGCDAYYRFTFQVTYNYGGKSLRLANLELVTTRPADQGGLLDTLMPFSWDYNKNITMGSNALYVSAQNNKVGLGTASPTTTFQITQPTSGPGTVSTNADTSLTGTNTTFTNTFKVGDTVTVSGETSRTITAIASDTSLTVSAAFANVASGKTYTAAGGTRMVVKGYGYVGIGTTTPQNLLDVKGGVAVGSYGGTNAAPSNGLIASGSVGIGTTNPLNKLDVNGGLAIGSYAGVNTSPTNGLIISGSVGIGTTNPSFKLDVAGSVRAQTGLTGTGANFSLDDGGVIDSTAVRLFSTGGNLYLQNGSGGATYFRSKTASTLMTVLNSGSVGINTTNPLSKLDVNGGLAVGAYAGVNAAPSNGLIVSGNVGIGTNNPSTLLALSGGIGSENGYNFQTAASDNMLVNGDFEQGTTSGWSGGGAIVSGGFTGGYSLQVTGSGANVLSDDYIPVDPGHDVMQLEAWLKKSVAGTTPGTLYIGYRAYDANKTVITTSPCGTYCYFAAAAYTLAADGNWHKFSATNTGEGTTLPNFPVGTRYIRALIMPNYGSSSDAVTLIDHVSVKRISVGSLFIGNNFNTTNLVDQSQTTQMYTNASNNLIIMPPGGGYVGLGVTNPGSALSLASSTVATGGIAFGTDTNLYRSAATTLKTDSLFNSAGGLQIGSGGTTIKKFLSSTATWDPASVATGAVTSTTLTVTGAALGDTVVVSFTNAVPAGMILSGQVTSANTVTVTLLNMSGSTQDLASGTLRGDIWQH